MADIVCVGCQKAAWECVCGRVEVRPDDPLMPKLSPEALKRLEAMERESMGALASIAQFPVGSHFNYHDEAGEHEPCYVVMPGGGMLYLAHCDQAEMDIARALFIVRACNRALAATSAEPTGASILSELTREEGDQLLDFVRYLRANKKLPPVSLGDPPPCKFLPPCAVCGETIFCRCGYPNTPAPDRGE